MYYICMLVSYVYGILQWQEYMYMPIEDQDENDFYIGHYDPCQKFSMYTSSHQ